MKKDPGKAQEAGEQLKEMIDSHNEFLADELRSIALIERKKYLGLLKQLNVVLDSQARSYEAGLAQIKRCQEGISKLLTPEEEDNLPSSLQEVIGSGPSLVDKKTGDVEKLEGAGSFVKPFDASGDFLASPQKEREKEKDNKEDSHERENGKGKDDAVSPRKDTVSSSSQPPAQPAAVPEPSAKHEDSLDSYLNALNESAAFFTPIRESDNDESSSEDASDDEASPSPVQQQQPLGNGSADGDPLQSLLKTFEGDRSVYVDKLN